MNYGLIIAHRFPGADPSQYSVVQEPDQQPELVYWDESALGPRPTEEQFRGWWLDAEKWEKRGRLRAAADAEYQKILFPEGAFTHLEKDEILEKKAAKRSGAAVNFGAGQQAASDTIDSLRAKRVDRFNALAAIAQQSGETLEQAVARVREIKW